MLYEIENMKKVYNGRTVLDLSHLAIERGRIIGLLGPNGAGKTTLMQILAFLLTPTAGTLKYEKQSVNFHDPELLNFRQKVVLVQQQPILFSTTVFKNVEFPVRIRRKPKEERARFVDDLLYLVGMESFRNDRAHNLSGGETQRVAIAQALACSPEVILLDEPTASVDVENQITIEHIIRQINREKGISVIMTTHDMVQASRVADEMLFMFEGKVARSIYENIFSGIIENGREGQKYCVTQSGLRFCVKTERSGSVRFSINPEALVIEKRKPGPLGDNCFKGKLLQLIDENDRVRAVVDVGIPLSLLIPKDHFVRLDLVMGETLQILVPPDSIEVF